MDIVSDEQYQVLLFVAACNRSFYNPTAPQVMLWRNNPRPAQAEYRTVQSPFGSLFVSGDATGSLQRMVQTMIRDQLGPFRNATSMLSEMYGPTKELVKTEESVIDHLIRLTWLTKVTSSDEEPGLRLTDLGLALLHDHERETTKEDVSVVLLEEQDPLAYPRLVGQLANAGEGLLVDPYLKLEGLAGIVTSTQLTRLLVSVKTGKAELSAMQTHLDSPRLLRRVEVRKSTKLHDRILLAEDGSVFTLGTSLNGVGSTTTVLTPTPLEAGAVLRDLYEQRWADAELVGPQPVEDEHEADGDRDDDGGTEQDRQGEHDAEGDAGGTDYRGPEE